VRESEREPTSVEEEFNPRFALRQFASTIIFRMQALCLIQHRSAVDIRQ